MPQSGEGIHLHVLLKSNYPLSVSRRVKMVTKSSLASFLLFFGQQQIRTNNFSEKNPCKTNTVFITALFMVSDLYSDITKKNHNIEC